MKRFVKAALLCISLIVIIGLLSGFTIPVPTASGSTVSKNEKAEIDYSNAKDGYVMVKCLKTTTNILRVQVTGPSGAKYQYFLNAKGNYDVYPFSDGNGSYKVDVVEDVGGGKYAALNSTTVSVTLANDKVPFITPNQYVNYNKDSKTVAKANELVKGASDTVGKVAAIYKFVLGFKYDNDRAASVKAGYVPNVDDVLAKSKGICFDYSAVMATMLRSQGIPTKLVVGYAGETYHAWISVYSDSAGWIDNVIQFDGKNWKLMDPTYASTGGSKADVMKYIGDGKNYTAKCYY